ncbi:hypothetical protein BCV72DRAFT_240539 [Rhizopus microsporus var. microsporus]|uniref:Uncharacterized protein n=1 Tax=Rhizopus microsporus var. microsporus TaxID=86635 RepID=A0A1X0R8M2_RHIZD|nr:hypothetical protein BCV72DRAFT_240539 [Rhizopus microsporus var. microsporus]
MEPVRDVTSTEPNKMDAPPLNNLNPQEVSTGTVGQDASYPNLEKKTLPDSRKSNKESIAGIIDNTMSRPAITLSINELSILSPSGRTAMKNRMTKSQRNPRTKIESRRLNVTAFTMNQNQLKGSIPKTRGQVNGIDCEMILDTSCSIFITGAHFAEGIGIKSLFSSSMKYYWVLVLSRSA